MKGKPSEYVVVSTTTQTWIMTRLHRIIVIGERGESMM